MSQSNSVVDDDEQLTDEEITRLARANGWRPKEQWKRDPDEWIDAAAFVQRGFETPKILKAQNKHLVDKFQRLETLYQTAEQQRKAETDELRGTVVTMTQMMRSAEERGLVRARKELQERQLKAVETGDTAAFTSANAELEELAKIKLPDIPVARATAAPPPATPTATPTGTLHPRIVKFYRDNPWYDQTKTRTDRDDEMMDFADSQHVRFSNTHKEWTIEENLDAVDRELRARYPDKFRAAGGGIRGNGAAQPIVAGRDDPDDDDDNPRRNGSASVSPSSGTSAPRAQRGRFTFDTMPKESKDAYAKYKAQIDSHREQRGNHIPSLTKEEWAKDYWGQFQDDGT